MAVSPDLLLNIKAPATAAKAASTASKPAPQASRDEASSFANVYAKERQAKPAERQDVAAKPARDKPTSEKPSQETAKTGGTEKPASADAGKKLPAESETVDSGLQGVEAELDPLLLFGMGGQTDVVQEQPTQQPTEQPPTGSEFLISLAQVQAPVQGDEMEGDVALAGQRLADIQPAVQKSLVSNDVVLDDASTNLEDKLPASLLVGEELIEDSEELSVEEGFGDLLDKLEAPKESRTSAVDASINRLNPLTQAITQQNQAQPVQRPTMVPGQPVQMQQSGWSEAVVDRVMWLSSQNLKSAEIQLDPAELGRMEVRIDMTKDQAQVTFLSPHAGVRDALEGQMQRLRDSFAQQGMTMDVNVSDQSRGWQGDGSGDSRGRGLGGASAAGDEEITQGTMEISTNRSGNGDRGLVDYYA